MQGFYHQQYRLMPMNLAGLYLHCVSPKGREYIDPFSSHKLSCVMCGTSTCEHMIHCGPACLCFQIRRCLPAVAENPCLYSAVARPAKDIVLDLESSREIGQLTLQVMCGQMRHRRCSTPWPTLILPGSLMCSNLGYC